MRDIFHELKILLLFYDWNTFLLFIIVQQLHMLSHSLTPLDVISICNKFTATNRF